MELERTAVDIRQCEKTFLDGTMALQPTNLCIEPGEVVALLGPSGCGKTTLLRIIAGLEKSDGDGSVWFGSDDVTHLPVERRGIGMVFQHYALFPQMSVASNIGYGLKIRGASAQEIKRTVGELVDLVRLNGLEHRKPKELSGGQRQRVALARAIAVRPKVLLLDEPLTALDAKLKESLRDELADLLRRLNITAIHVTHDQHEAMSIADRLVVMLAGKVVQVGTAEDLYRSPKHPFVASFLGRINTLKVIQNNRGQTGVCIAGMWIPCSASLNKDSMVMLRPEDISLSVVASLDSPTKIAHRVFLGDRVHLRVYTEDAGDLLVDAARDCPFQAGESVKVHVAAEALMSFGDY